MLHFCHWYYILVHNVHGFLSHASGCDIIDLACDGSGDEGKEGDDPVDEADVRVGEANVAGLQRQVGKYHAHA